MARRSISIDEKIERQKDVVSAAKDKYDAALAELDRLMQKKKELQGKELLEAFARSNKSLEDVLKFMQDEVDEDE